MAKDKHLSWGVKYNPTKLSDYIVSDEIRAKSQEWIDEGAVQNVMLDGSPGIGKSTWASFMSNSVTKTRSDVLTIDGSKHNGVDVVRNIIYPFISSQPIASLVRVVVIEEFDRFTPEAQEALRQDMVVYEHNARFITTCNYGHKIAPALHSRFIGFNVTPTMDNAYMLKVAKRVFHILERENISNVNYDEINSFIDGKGKIKSEKTMSQLTYILSIIRDKMPDIRSVIKMVQYACVGGKLSEKTIVKIPDYCNDILEVFTKQKASILERGNEILSILRTNKVNSIDALLNYLFDNADKINPTKYPQIVVMLQQMMVQDINAANKIFHIMGYVWQILYLEDS